MSEILNLVLEQTGGPAGLIILLLSLASNVALYLGKRNVVRITKSVIAGVQAWRDNAAAEASAAAAVSQPELPTPDVAQFIQTQATNDGVEAQLHKLVKSVTEGPAAG